MQNRKGSTFVQAAAALDEFRDIYRREFKEEVGEDEAREMATWALSLFALLLKKGSPQENLHSEKQHDTLGKQMATNQPTEKEQQALRFLRNAIVHEGYSPSVRDLARALQYKSPRTAFLVLGRLIEQGWVKRKSDGKLQLRKDLAEAEDHARTVEVPLVGTVACGMPILAEENVEACIPVSTSLARPGSNYFLLRATGDSMNRAGIEDGDLLLVRQQPQAENGDKVVALIDDEATVKEFRREKDVVVLRPKSRNKDHRPIVLSENFLIQGVVTSVLPRNLY